MKKFWKSGNQVIRPELTDAESDLEYAFANVKPEDFNYMSLGDIPPLRSSANTRPLLGLIGKEHLTPDYIFSVERAVLMITPTGIMVPDLPYIIEHILEQHKLGVTNPNEVAHAILLSCADEFIGLEQGAHPADVSSNDLIATEVSVAFCLNVVGALLGCLRLAIENGEKETNTKFDAISLSFFISFFNSRLNLLAMNTAPQGEAYGIGGETVGYPTAILSQAARILEGSARMMESGLWTFDWYGDEEAKAIRDNEEIVDFRDLAKEIRDMIAGVVEEFED